MRAGPLIAGLAAAAVLAAPLPAQETGVELGGLNDTDSDEPLEVTSQRLELTRSEGTALFTGEVEARQGELQLYADWVLVEYVQTEEGEIGDTIDRITAREDVVLITPSEAAEGDEAVYTPATNEVVMTGNVLLTQGNSTVAGNRMRYNLETGIGSMEGQVRTVLQPAEDDSAEAGQ